MARLFEIAFDFCVQRPRRTLLVSIGILFVALIGIRQITIQLDLFSKVEKGFVSTFDYQDQRARYKDANNAFFIVSPGERKKFSTGELCLIRHWLHAEQDTRSELLSVASPFLLKTADVENEELVYKPYLKLDCGDERRRDEAMDLSPLKATPWGLALTDSSASDISAEFLFQEPEPGERGARFDPLIVGRVESDARKFFAQALPGASVHFLGPAVFHAHIKTAMLRDIAMQSLVFLIFLVAFRALFGSWRSGVVFIASVLVTLLLVYGLMAVVGHPLDILTSNLVLMTAIAGLEDFLFVALLMKTSKAGCRQALRAMAAPCFFTTLTTVIGFFALQTSGVDIIGRFGLWAGAAVLCEWAVLFFMFPACLYFCPLLGEWVNQPYTYSPRWVKRLALLNPPRFALWLGAFMFVGGIAGFWRLNINEHPTRNFPAGHDLSRSYSYVQQSRGWENAVSLVFQGENIRSQRGKIESVLKEISMNPLVAGTTSPFDLEDFVAGTVTKDWGEIPRFEIQFTKAYARSFNGGDQARGVIYLKTSELSALNQVIKQIDRLCPDRFCFAAGQSVVYLEFADKIVPALLSSFVTSAFLVVLILIMLAKLHGTGNYLAVAYSALWGPVVMIGVISLFQIPVSLVTSIFAATIVGLTGDNGIQFIFGARGGPLSEGVESRAETSVILGLLLAVSSLVFALETIRPMRILGLLFFIGFVINLVGDLWILRACISRERSTPRL